MDVFLFDVSKSNKGEPKLSKTASVIHNVPKEVTLAALKEIVRGHQGTNSVIYVPANGFYWLRKASKQMVELGTEADLVYCKEEYKGASIRIGCASVDVNTVLTGYYAPINSLPQDGRGRGSQQSHGNGLFKLHENRGFDT